MSDPLTDLRQEIQGLRADVVSGRIEQARLDERLRRMEDEADRIAKEYVPVSRLVPLERVVWTTVSTMIVGLVGGAIAVLTR